LAILLIEIYCTSCELSLRIIETVNNLPKFAIMNGTNCVDRNGVKGRRPPGGTSSDIFGPPIVHDIKRRTNNNTESSIFDGPTTATPSPQRQKRQQEDTQNKLFGDPEPLAPIQITENGEENGEKSVPATRVRQPPGGVASKLW